MVEAVYELPFLAHAAMEPMNCTVHVRKDACEVWVGTQVMTKAQNAAALESGLRADQVIVHNHLIGGGFGRRLEADGVATAVRIARHVDGPVKIVWTREEDIQQEMYRPVYHNRMAARLEDGRITAWHHRVVGPSIIARFLPAAFAKGIDADAVDGAVDQPYDLPNVNIEFVRHEPEAIPTAFWRGVGPNSNIFSAECFIDRLATKPERIRPPSVAQCSAKIPVRWPPSISFSKNRDGRSRRPTRPKACAVGGDCAFNPHSGASWRVRRRRPGRPRR